MLCQICHEEPATFRIEHSGLVDLDPVKTVPLITFACQSCAREGMDVTRRMGLMLNADLPYSMTLDTSLRYSPEPVDEVQRAVDAAASVMDELLTGELAKIDVAETFERWERVDPSPDPRKDSYN